MSGKKVLLWMRGKTRSLDVLLDEAPCGPIGLPSRAAAEEALRVQAKGVPLPRCGQDIVTAALKAGGSREAIEAVAGASGMSFENARRILGF